MFGDDAEGGNPIAVAALWTVSVACGIGLSLLFGPVNVISAAVGFYAGYAMSRIGA